MKTDEMIKALSADTRYRKPTYETVFTFAVLISLLVVAVELLSTIGIRPDFATAIETLRYPFKVVVTGSLAVTSLIFLTELCRPGADTRKGEALILIAPLLMGAAIGLEMLVTPSDQWLTLQIGTRSRVCLTVIPLFGFIPLGLFLWVMRYTAPMKPALTGAIAGLLAGGISASFYALHCDNDSPLFVATWYSLAIMILAGLGAFGGSRLARW